MTLDLEIVGSVDIAVSRKGKKGDKDGAQRPVELPLRGSLSAFQMMPHRLASLLSKT